ncbi:MAG: glycosyltransferase family 2 protein, partial [Cyanobium sp.]
FVLQYVLPVMAVADLIGTLISGTPPAMWPFSVVALGLSGFSMLQGCRRASEGPELPPPTLFNLALGIVYLIHWFVVIPWVTLKMAVLPKSLVWAKTAHGVVEADLPGQSADDLDEDIIIDVATE